MAVTKNHFSTASWTSSGTSQTVTTSTGNCSVVVVSCNTGGTTAITSVTDSASNNYVLAGDLICGDSPGNESTTVWYAKNVATGITSIKITWTGTPSAPAVWADVYDLGGTDPTNPLQAYSVIQHIGTIGQTSYNGPTVSLPTAGGFMITVLTAGSGLASSINSPFSIDDNAGPGFTYSLFVASGQAASAGAYTPDWVWANSNTVKALTVAFKSTPGVPLLIVQSVVPTSNPMTFTPTAAGNLIVAMIVNLNNGMSNLTDNATGGSNLYKQCTGAQAVDPNNEFFDIWYCASAKSAGVTQLTVSFLSGGSFNYALIFEIQGADPNTPFDKATALNNGVSQPGDLLPTTPLTTSHPVEILCCNMDLNASFSWPYFIDPAIAHHDSTNGTSGASQIISSQGTYTMNGFTSNTGIAYGASVAAFIGAGQITSGQQGYGATGDADFQWLGGN